MVNKQIQQSDDSESYEEHRVGERVKGNGGHHCGHGGGAERLLVLQ